MQFRHEIKHEISEHDMLILRSRLSHILKPDKHTKDGKYEIRSLYFDSPDDKALREKLDGVSVREKYRIRLYNNDTSFIRLERKFKYAGLGYKDNTPLTERETRAIISGDIEWMSSSPDEVIQGFYSRLKHERLVPKVIVDYTREPFVFPAGNVRVTLDYNIRTGLGCVDIFDPNCASVPIKDSNAVLEVKWDKFLPDIVREAIQLDSRRNTAFSKYAACRMYD